MKPYSFFLILALIAVSLDFLYRSGLAKRMLFALKKFFTLDGPKYDDKAPLSPLGIVAMFTLMLSLELTVIGLGAIFNIRLLIPLILGVFLSFCSIKIACSDAAYKKSKPMEK